MTGYTEFSGTVEEQSGNYLALKVDATEGSTTTVEVVNGTKGPVTLDSDMNIVLLIKNKDNQSVKIVTSLGGESVEKTFGLSGLTLESAE